MKSFILCLVGSAVLMTACDQHRTKFHVGDRVRVKLSPFVKEGVVIAWQRLFVEDHYTVQVAMTDGRSDTLTLYDTDLERIPESAPANKLSREQGKSKVSPIVRAAVLGRRAEEQLKQGDVHSALDVLSYALQLDPRNPRVHWLRGSALEEREKFTDALRDYTSAIEIEPDNAQTHIKRGLLLSAMGDSKRAFADLDRAINLKPSEAIFYFHRGGARYQRGEHAAAVSDLTKALELDPSQPVLYAQRGLARFGNGDCEGAMSDLYRAIAEKPYDDDFYYSRGTVFLRSGEDARAIADFSKALELNSTNWRAHNELAYLLATSPDSNLRNGSDAIKHARVALDLKRANKPLVLDTLAAAYAETGNFEEAVRFETQAIATGSNVRGGEGRLSLYLKRKAYRHK